MRITLNFAAAESWRDRYALAWAIPATLVGALGLVLLGVAVVRQTHQAHAIQREAAEVQQREKQLRAEEMALRKELSDPQHAGLLRQARFVNSLLDQKDLSLTELVKEVASILPNDAHLTELALVRQEKAPIVRFSITAKSEEALETFLNDLEDSPDFQDVAILNQGFQDAGPKPGALSVVCVARYLPGAHR